MSLNDPLADALFKINHYEQLRKKECTITNVSNLLLKVLEILKDNRYIGDFSVEETSRGRVVKVNLLHRITELKAIKPRFSIKKDEYVNVEKRYLPAKGFGIVIVSTPKGIMTHKDAIKENLGGRLIAYCY
ncbi:MAG: small subunit ribosomal protein [Candidatus Woesearchaeota archaeon]|nr:small subunit ribosomal protein [Candidatus Woesearchaeota archaeon]MDN5327991.1 small subunit ribosomal protein [Candidatus Woesearchaeota archaeon]